MKQTAVEWLIEQLPNGDFDHQKIVIAQAKEMEKEQICNAFFDGGDIGLYRYKSDVNYYNITFNKDETKR